MEGEQDKHDSFELELGSSLGWLCESWCGFPFVFEELCSSLELLGES